LRLKRRECFSLMYKKIIVPCILAVIVFLIYSHVLYSPFVLDDTDNIVDNLRIKDLSNFFDFSGSRYIGYLTFGLNYYFSGLNPFGYHFVNIIIHIINGLLVYSLVALTFKTPVLARTPVFKASFFSPPFVIAIIVSLIFVTHPIQTQAVTYITQRFASLATLFYLLALVLYIKARLAGGERVAVSPSFLRFYLFSLVSVICAMKTKEISFTLPFVLFLYDSVFFTPWRGGRRFLFLIPFLCTVVIIPLSRIEAAVTIGEVSESGVGRVSYFLTQMRVIVTYIRLLILPVNQNLDYDYPIYQSIFEIPVMLSFLFLVSVFAIVLIFLYQSWRRGNPYGLLISFGMMWFFMTLSVESSVVPLLNVIFEHRLYLPSVGFIMAVVLVVYGGIEWAGRRWLGEDGVKGVMLFFLISAVAVTLTLSVATYRRNLIWKDDFTLWSDAAAKSPNNPRTHVNLGVAYYDRGSKDNAIAEYLKALELKPDAAMAHLGLGRIYVEKGLINKAKKEYMMALELEPEFAEAYNNLGNIYLIQREFSLAAQQYEEALRLKRDNIEAYYNLALAYDEIGSKEAALKYYRTFIEMAPSGEYQIIIERAKRRIRKLSF
jgi:Tfp pilus assembly protein PilF